MCGTRAYHGLCLSLWKRKVGFFFLNQALRWRFACKWSSGLAFLRGPGARLVYCRYWRVTGCRLPSRRGCSLRWSILFGQWQCLRRTQLRASSRQHSGHPGGMSVVGPERQYEWPTAASTTRATGRLSCQKDSKCTTWNFSIYSPDLVGVHIFLSCRPSFGILVSLFFPAIPQKDVFLLLLSSVTTG